MGAHLYLADLSTAELVERASEIAQRWLPAEQLQRITDVTNTQVREQKLRQKAALYLLLERHLQHGQPVPALDYQSSGKPRLADHPNVHFNLSHSGHWLALAISDAGPVGVDVEAPRRRRSIMAIAEQYFHPAEIEHLKQQQPDKQTAEFYRLWTLKEAFFKARGTGIAEGLPGINFITTETPKTNRNWPLTQWQYHHQPVSTAEGDIYLSYILPATDAKPQLNREFLSVLD